MTIFKTSLARIGKIVISIAGGKNAKVRSSSKKHLQRYPNISICIIHPFFALYKLDILTIEEESIAYEESQLGTDMLPAIIFNIIYDEANEYAKDLKDSLDELESSIEELKAKENPWYKWLESLFLAGKALTKDDFIYQSTQNTDAMTNGWVEWEVGVGEKVRFIEQAIISHTGK